MTRTDPRKARALVPPIDPQFNPNLRYNRPLSRRDLRDEMADSVQERRFTTIVAVDIVGYSRLVEKNEDGTLSAIKVLRLRLIDPLLTEYSGRIVKLMGDGALMEFAFPVKAVAFAIALQKRVDKVQKRVALRKRLVFRVGINSGEVVPDGDDLLGHGVNIAARLEQICEPGGILISGSVYDRVRGKLGVMLDFTGEQHVKNIAQPIKTYRVSLDGVGPDLRLFRRRVAKSATVWAAIFLVVIGTLTLLRPLLSAARPAKMCPNLNSEIGEAMLSMDNTNELDRFVKGLKSREFSFVRDLPGDKAAHMHGFGRRFAFSYNELSEWLENNVNKRVTLYDTDFLAEAENVLKEERLIDQLLQRDDSRPAAVYLRAVQWGLCDIPGVALDPGSPRPDFRKLPAELAGFYPSRQSQINSQAFSRILQQLSEYTLSRPDTTPSSAARELRRLILEAYDGPADGRVA